MSKLEENQEIEREAVKLSKAFGQELANLGVPSDSLEWCKKRALQYCDIGDYDQAFASMSSDLSKHPETEKHIGIALGLMLLMAGHLKGQECRDWITGFN